MNAPFHMNYPQKGSKISPLLGSIYWVYFFEYPTLDNTSE